MSEDYSKIIAYYENQATGRGVGGSGYKLRRSQKGFGVGSYLSALFSKIYPYIKSGASAVGSELLNTGIGLLRDHINNKDLKSSIEDRVGTAGSNLSTKATGGVKSMLGLGYKRKRTQRKTKQSRPVKRRKKTSKKKRSKKRKTVKRVKKDIFGF